MHTTSVTRPDVWYPVGSDLGEFARTWAERADVMVFVGENVVGASAGKSAGARFDHSTAQIEIEGGIAFAGMPPEVVGDIPDRRALSRWPVAGGMVLHESMHARFSRADKRIIWDSCADPDVYAMWILLEELRVEAKAVLLFPRDRSYLKASTQAILMEGDGNANRSPRKTCVLILGRADAGVLSQGDVKDIRDWILTVDGWTEDILVKASALFTEYVYLDGSATSLSRMIEIAREVETLLPQDPSPETGEAEELSELLGEILGEIIFEAIGELVEAAETEAQEKQQQDRDKRDAEKKWAEVVAQETFNDSDDTESGTLSKKSKERPPSSAERGAAVRLSKALDRAKYRDRTTVQVDSERPPGHLRTTVAMRKKASYVMTGARGRYEPFRRTEHHEVTEPPLTVGMMCDISGSMTATMPAMGTAAWVISNAVSRISRARAAQVYFGQGVYPGLRVNETMGNVREWTATEGHEKFDRGFQALDGALNLLDGKGARLLVVSSDGNYGRKGEREACHHWMKRCAKSRVGVVWLDLRGADGTGAEYCAEAGPSAVHVELGPKILDAIDEIGLACIRALEHAGR